MGNTYKSKPRSNIKFYYFSKFQRNLQFANKKKKEHIIAFFALVSN